MVLPFALSAVRRWQHLSQLSRFPLLPRGFLAGHFLPVAMQASAPAALRRLPPLRLSSLLAPRFLPPWPLASVSSEAAVVRPTAASELPTNPLSASRRLAALASRVT